MHSSGPRPPTTSRVLSGRTAAKHEFRGCFIWLMILHLFVVGSYIRTATVEALAHAPPIARSLSLRDTDVVSVTGRSATRFHVFYSDRALTSRAPNDFS